MQFSVSRSATGTLREPIGFCSAPDDVRIAYAVCGEGPGWPLERVATWLTHREYDGGVYRHWRKSERTAGE